MATYSRPASHWHARKTGYFGLMDVGQPQPGETVVVSGAAGADGQTAGHASPTRRYFACIACRLLKPTHTTTVAAAKGVG